MLFSIPSKYLLQCGFKPTQFLQSKQPKRYIWGWLYAVFNRVDADRVKLVGPDRACAEWILRSGGKIHWKGKPHVEKDYNSLPLSNFKLYKVETIDATDTAVMSIGFYHLEGLMDLKKIILDNCKYLNDDALQHLHFVKESLEHLQLTGAGDVTERGLKHLTVLSKLQYLYLEHLPEIRKKKECLEYLRKELPGCDIHYPDIEPKTTESSPSLGQGCGQPSCVTAGGTHAPPY